MFEFLAYLAAVTIRSLVLFGVGASAILAFRIKGAAARHAVWTIVACGMLVLAAVSLLLPPLPIPVLRSVVATPSELPDLPGLAIVPSPGPSAPAPSWRVTWPFVAVALYAILAAVLLTRLLFSYLITRSLVRAATPVSGSENVYSSTWISVPVTVTRSKLRGASSPARRIERSSSSRSSIATPWKKTGSVSWLLPAMKRRVPAMASGGWMRLGPRRNRHRLADQTPMPKMKTANWI